MALCVAACGGGGAKDGTGGAGGSGSGGEGAGGATGTGGATSGTGGAGGAATGTGGSGPSTTGPGIPTGGDAHCLLDATTPDAAFYFGYNRACVTPTRVSGTASDTEKAALKAGLCVLAGGTAVDACPTTDTPVAYCFGTQSFVLDAMLVPYNVFKVVYMSAVNPSAEAVARDALAVCGGSSVYDLDNHLLTTSCTGTVKAMVDGTLVDFSGALICTFVGDGTRSLYAITATDVPNSANGKTLNLSFLKDAAGLGLKAYLPTQAAAGYSEGGSATGVYSIVADATALTFTPTTFDETGAAISGTFEVGVLKTGSGATRTVTGGTIDITYTVNR